MKMEHKIFSITLFVFVIILLIGIVAKKAQATNSPITAMDSFYKKLGTKNATNGPVIAVQNRSKCEVIIGRKIAGKIEWASWVAPGATWIIEGEKAEQFCEGTD
jgi:hypothetical protein